MATKEEIDDMVANRNLLKINRNPIREQSIYEQMYGKDNGFPDWIVGSIITIGIALIMAIPIWQSVDKQPRTGIVVSHDATSNKSGGIYYNTLVKCDDGYIRKVEDMNMYIKPIGSRVTIYTFN